MTKNQLKKNYILEGLSGFMKQNGFKKNASTFRRETEKGLLHIIQLNLGRSWSIKKGEICITFGIYTNEWREFLQSWSKSSNITISDCELQDNFCTLVDQDFMNKWYKINRWYMPNNHLDDLIVEMTSGIKKNILPFLELHDTRLKIVTSYRKFGKNIGLPPRHNLSIAILNYAIGNFDSTLEQMSKDSERIKNSSFYKKVYNNLTNEIKKRRHNKT